MTANVEEFQKLEKFQKKISCASFVNLLISTMALMQDFYQNFLSSCLSTWLEEMVKQFTFISWEKTYFLHSDVQI